MAKYEAEDNVIQIGKQSRRIVGILRRRVWVVVGCTLLVTVAALATSFLETTEYSSTAHVRIQDPTQYQLPYAPQPFSKSDGATEVSLSLKLTSLDPVAELTAKKVRPSLTTEDVIEAVAVTTQDEPFKVSATAVASDAVYAAEIANTYVRSYLVVRRKSDHRKITDALTPILNERRKLSRRERNTGSGRILKLKIERLLALRKLLRVDDVKTVEHAEVASSPDNKSKLPNLVGGLFLGLLLGIGTAVLMERQEHRKNLSAPSIPG